MSRQRSSKKLDKKSQPDPHWNLMLLDVEAEIGKASRRLADLKQSAAIIRNRIEAGEAFPEGWITKPESNEEPVGKP